MAWPGLMRALGEAALHVRHGKSQSVKALRVQNINYSGSEQSKVEEPQLKGKEIH